MTDEGTGEEAGTQEEQLTPTAEEQMETLKAELEAKKAQIHKTESSLQGLRGSLQEKDRLLKEQASISSQIGELRETQQVFATLLSDQGRLPEDGLEPEKRQDAIQAYQDLATKQTERRKQAETKAQQDADYNKAMEIYKRAEEALGDDPDALYSVRNMLSVRDWDLVEKKIAKAEGKKMNEPTETEEARIQRLVDEKYKERLGDEGLLTNVEKISSAGAGILKDADFIEKFASGKLPATKQNIERVNVITNSQDKLV